jgi:hypothetical protein
LPNPFRNVTIPQLTSPLVNFAPTGGISIAGQNDFFNSVQIDGCVNNDLYYAGVPGQGVLPHIISIGRGQGIPDPDGPVRYPAGELRGGGSSMP